MRSNSERSGYNFSKMKVGDWFIGCPDCGFQHKPNTAAYPICPFCDIRMRHVVVTKLDVFPKNETGLST